MSYISPLKRLKELFNTLPVVTPMAGVTFAPSFVFGTHKYLLRVLKNAVASKTDPYPIIFAQTPIIPTGSDQIINFDLVLILATKTRSNYSNEQRLEKTFEQVLYPLIGNVLTALKESGFTRITNLNNYKTSEFYNYGAQGDTVNEVTDIWDAIKLEVKIEMTDDCLTITSNNY